MNASLPTSFRPSQLVLLELLKHHHPTTDLSLVFPFWTQSPFPFTYIALLSSQMTGAVYGMMKRELGTQSLSSTSGSLLKRSPYFTFNSSKVGTRFIQWKSAHGGQGGDKRTSSLELFSRPWKSFFLHLMTWSVIPILATGLHHQKPTSSNHPAQKVSYWHYFQEILLSSPLDSPTYSHCRMLTVITW